MTTVIAFVAGTVLGGVFGALVMAVLAANADPGRPER